MTATVRKEIHRGQQLYRPICANASLFAGLAGTVFLNADAIVVIQRLGFAVIYAE